VAYLDAAAWAVVAAAKLTALLKLFSHLSSSAAENEKVSFRNVVKEAWTSYMD
jgi:hypothetical protein